jgi:hypothetical protein
VNLKHKESIIIKKIFLNEILIAHNYSGKAKKAFKNIKKKVFS